MKPAKSLNEHLKPAARGPLPALSEAATGWSSRLRVLAGPAATLCTADSLGSRPVSSRPRTPTAYSKYIGRVGALAIALGVGGAILAAPGVAWANESSSTASESTSNGESGGQSGRSASSSKIATKRGLRRHFGQQRRDDGPGVIVRGSGGSHTSGTDNQSVRRSQADEATAPDLEQPITPEEEVALPAPPETRVTTPLDAPKRKAARVGRNSDTKQVAPLSAPTRAAAPTEKDADTRRVASRSTDAPAARTEIGDAGLESRSSAVTATAGETNEWNAQSVGAAFTTPSASASSAPQSVDLINGVFAPLQDRGPMGLDSPVMWAVLGWARRQFTERFANRTRVADLAQTTQVEPLGPAQAASVEGISVLGAADSSIDTGVAAEQVGPAAQAAQVEGPKTSIFFESSPRIGETGGTVRVPIVRTGDLSQPSTIEYGITSDTATEGDDYIGGSGTITMAADQDRAFIDVQILDDDLSEPTETFVVSIINVDSGSTILYPRTARIDILDDENPVVDPPSPPLTSDYFVTEEVVVSGLDQPLAFEFAEVDGKTRIYIAEKGGKIKVFDTATGGTSEFVNISPQVNNIQDRGLMDIALHPNFGQPGLPGHDYVYAFYVVDPHGTENNTGNAGPDGGGNRFAYLVRFSADPATNYTTAVEGSEVILLGGVPVAGQVPQQPRTLADISGGGAVDSTSNFSQPESGFNAQTGEYVDSYFKVDSRSHAGGALAFGPDGALYLSIGDGTSFNATDPRSVSVQEIDSLSGKILRIDPITGLGMPDNPFVEPGDDLSTNRAKVYQLGLRNPFSMGFSEDGRLFITNTGWNVWEEIESGHPGANFGWPYFEGGDNGALVLGPGYQDLDSAAAFYAAVANGTITITPAYRAFAHSESDRVISSGPSWASTGSTQERNTQPNSRTMSSSPTSTPAGSTSSISTIATM